MRVLLALSLFLLIAPQAAQATMYAPGATLDPACAPTDSNCGVQSNTAVGTLGQVPYYAAAGNVLAATSTFQILTNGTASTTSLVVSNSFTLANLSGFLKATAGAIATSLINLASDVTGILPVANGGTGVSAIQSGFIPFGNGTGAVATSSSFYWDNSNGRLGIGTTSPYSLLSISNNLNTAANTSLFTIASTTGGTSTSTLMTVLANGNVGIGTTTPFAKFSVVGNGYFSGALSVGDVTIGSAILGAGTLKYSPMTTVFEGDSITAGGGLTKSADNTVSCRTSLADASCLDWPSQLVTLSPSAMQAASKNNFAISGNYISDLQARYTSSVHPLSPAITGNPGTLFVWAGSNDYAFNFAIPNEATAIESGLGAYWSGAKADGWIVVAFTIQRRGDASTIEKEVARQQVNQWIRSQYQAGAYDYLVDVDAIVPTPFDQSIFQSDTVHLNSAGAYLVARYVNSVLWNHGIISPISTREVPIGTGTGNFAADVMSLGKITSGINNTSIGYDSISITTSGSNNSALGFKALRYNTTGSSNTANGYEALYVNTTGSSNTALGQFALAGNTTASQNTAVGVFALQNNSVATGNSALGYGVLQFSTADYNTSVGWTSLAANTTGSSNVAVGVQASRQNTTGGNNVAIGSNALYSNTTGQNNTGLGGGAGYTGTPANANVTGSNNTWVGSSSGPGSSTQYNYQTVIGGAAVGTCSNCVILGRTVDNVGIGTTTPYSRLTVWGPDALAGTAAFTIANSASTTEFQVFDNGSATLAGTLTQNSDERLKQNITSLDASSTLAAIASLTPVSFIWRDPSQGSTTQLGFIAQDVQKIFPQLVSTTSATALTPGGTLGINYIGLISPLIEAVKELAGKVSRFAQSITTHHLKSDDLCLKKSDGSEVCVTGDQLHTFLQMTNQQSNFSNTNTNSNPITITDVPPTDTSATTTDSTGLTSSPQAATTTNDTQATTTPNTASTTPAE